MQDVKHTHCWSSWKAYFDTTKEFKYSRKCKGNCPVFQVTEDLDPYGKPSGKIVEYYLLLTL